MQIFGVADIFTVTESKEFKNRQAKTSSPSEDPRNYSLDAETISLLNQKSQLTLNKAFARNGNTLPVSGQGIDLDLTLASNRLLFVTIDWGQGEQR